MRGRKPKIIPMPSLAKPELPTDREILPCPSYLKGEERRAWKYLVGELEKMGVLSSSDRAIMSAYCDAWGRWRKAKRLLNEMQEAARESGEKNEIEIIKTGVKRTIQKNGTVVESGGNWIQNPWVGFANRALADLVKYGAELGLSPVQRVRMQIGRDAGVSRRQKLLG